MGNILYTIYASRDHVSTADEPVSTADEPSEPVQHEPVNQSISKADEPQEKQRHAKQLTSGTKISACWREMLKLALLSYGNVMVIRFSSFLFLLEGRFRDT